MASHGRLNSKVRLAVVHMLSTHSHVVLPALAHANSQSEVPSAWLVVRETELM